MIDAVHHPDMGTVCGVFQLTSVRIQTDLSAVGLGKTVAVD